VDNFFIAQYFDWRFKPPPRIFRIFNRLLSALGITSQFYPAIGTGLMNNIQRRMNLFHLISEVLVHAVPGDLVELGCYEGKTAVLMQTIIQHWAPSRRLHVYDSFQGQPAPGRQDRQGSRSPYAAGRLLASVDQVLGNFKRYQLPEPCIHPGWFQDTLPSQLPDQICFAHLDGDLYDSILMSLRHVYPRLTAGAVCVIDDYSDPSLHAWNRLPGVKQACDEFFAGKAEKVSCLYAGEFAQGYFRKG
jgi:O-methyltransferase